MPVVAVPGSTQDRRNDKMDLPVHRCSHFGECSGFLGNELDKMLVEYVEDDQGRIFGMDARPDPARMLVLSQQVGQLLLDPAFGIHG